MRNDIVLIAEDNSELRDVLVELAGERCDRVEVCTKGGDLARRVLEEERPLLITDCDLDNGNRYEGIDAIREIRKRNKIAPIMINGGFDEIEGWIASDRDYERKPLGYGPTIFHSKSAHLREIVAFLERNLRDPTEKEMGEFAGEIGRIRRCERQVDRICGSVGVRDIKDPSYLSNGIAVRCFHVTEVLSSVQRPRLNRFYKQATYEVVVETMLPRSSQKIYSDRVSPLSVVPTGIAADGSSFEFLKTHFETGQTKTGRYDLRTSEVTETEWVKEE